MTSPLTILNVHSLGAKNFLKGGRGSAETLEIVSLLFNIVQDNTLMQ